MTWTNIPKDYSSFIGFIYLIRNTNTGQFYIGQKTFFKTVTRAKPKELTKEMIKRRDLLDAKYESGIIQTKKAYKEELKKLKTREKAHFDKLVQTTQKQRRETDWREYWSSSEILKKDTELYGKEQFTREILVCCETKGMLNYAETFLQMKFGCVFDVRSYNGLVNIRANNKMFQNYQEECKVMLQRLNEIEVK